MAGIWINKKCIVAAYPGHQNFTFHRKLSKFVSVLFESSRGWNLKIWTSRTLFERRGMSGSSKQDKYVLRRSAKKSTFDEGCSGSIYVDEGQGWLTLKRMAIKGKKVRSFQECHSSGFAGHTGRVNTIKKIKERQRIKQTFKRWEKSNIVYRGIIYLSC